MRDMDITIACEMYDNNVCARPLHGQLVIYK